MTSWTLHPPLGVLQGQSDERPYLSLPWDWKRPRQRSGRSLFDHQAVGARYLQEHNGGALFMGMRTGKSLTLVEAIIRGGVFPHLILCPVSVMATWENEFLSEGLGESEINLIRDGDRASQLVRPGPLVTILNFEVVRKTHALRVREDLPAALGIPNWAGITVDESFRISNPSTIVTREILRSHRPPGQFRAILSGAPASESGLNLASQFFFLDDEFFSCSDMVEYLRKHCRMDPRSRRWIPESAHHLDEIREMVKVRAYCVQMADLHMGVDKVYQIWNVEPTEAQSRAMEWCVLANTYQTTDDTGKTVTRLMEPLVRSTFMSKASAGLDPLTDEILSDRKPRMILEWLQEHPEESALVLSRFTSPIKTMVSLLVAAGIATAAITGETSQPERERIRQAFQAGGIRVVVGQVKTVKMGMDFSRASYLFYLSNSYSQDDRIQSEDRGNHAQKRGILQIVDLCTKGGNDRKLVSLLTQKKALSQSYIQETVTRWAMELKGA